MTKYENSKISKDEQSNGYDIPKEGPLKLYVTCYTAHFRESYRDCSIEGVGYEIDPSRITMPFGKHKNMKLSWIEENDPDYILYIMNETCPWAWIKSKTLLEGLGYCRLRINGKRNKDNGNSLWYQYQRELKLYNDTWEEIKRRRAERDDRVILVDRLLHRAKRNMNK